MAVVSGLDPEDAVIHPGIIDGKHPGGGVVDGQLRGQGAALAQSLIGEAAVRETVVVGHSSHGNIDPGALGQGCALRIRALPVQLGILHGIAPLTHAGIIVCRIQLAQLPLEVDLAAVGVGDLNPGCACAADQGEALLGDAGGILAVEGIALGQVGAVIHDGVAAVVILRAVAVIDAQRIAVGADHLVQVGGGIAGHVNQIHQGAPVIHARLGPVAVEGQHGDGVDGSLLTLGIGHAPGIDEGLHKGTLGVLHSQLFPGLVAQLHADADADALAGGDGDGVAAQGGQQQMGVIGVDLTVAADIAAAVQVGHIAHHIFQQMVGICRVGSAVAVQVTVCAVRAAHGCTGEGRSALQRSGPGIQEPNPAVRHILEHILTEQVCAQRIGLVGIGDVGDGEVEGVDAGTLGIIAQLGLDLVILLTLHPDEGIGLRGQIHPGETCALVHQGVVIAAGVLLIKGLCGGHQQALGQMAGADAGLLLQAVLSVDLGQQSGHTGDLGRGHGGAGHGLILVRAAAGNVVGAPDGIDRAAGGGDLGLQGQAAGNAPGAEIAHVVILRAIQTHALFAADGDAAGQVAALIPGSCPDGGGIRLGDAHHGGGIVQAGQIHAVQTGLIVVDDHAHRAAAQGVVGLLRKIQGAAGDQDDLSGDVDAAVFLGIAQTVQEDIPILGAVQVQALVQAGKGRVAIAQILAVEVILTAHGEIVAHGAVVVHGGHGEGILIGAGRAHGVEGHIIVVQVAEGGGHGPVGGVARGDDHHGVGFGHHLHQTAVDIGIGGTGHGGAHGEVHRIAVEQDGILDGCHVIGVKGAAVAEDLHGDELCIGGNTQHHDGLPGIGIAAALGDQAVGGGNARHMGAVLALTVIVMGDVQGGIHIVEAEGQLLVAIELCGGDAGHPLIGVELRQHLGNGLLRHQVQGSLVSLQAHALCCGILRQSPQIRAVVKGLVVGIRAGVDDGDAGARTGVAAVPQNAGADHAGAGVGAGHGILHPLCHGRLILGLHGHGPDAVDGGDLLQGAIGHPGGDDVAHQGHVPDHVQGTAVQGLPGDGLFHGLLGSLKLRPVAHGLGIGGDAHGGKARLHGGGSIQHDGHAHQLLRRPLRCAVLLDEPVGKLGGDLLICLFPGHAGCTRRRNKRQHHANHKQPGTDPL